MNGTGNVPTTLNSVGHVKAVMNLRTPNMAKVELRGCAESISESLWITILPLVEAGVRWFPRVRFVLDEHRLEAALIERTFALVELVEQRRIAAIEVAHAVGEIGFGSSQVDVKVVVEQRDGEDSPTAAACDALEEPPPVAAVVVVQHDVSSIEAVLGDVMDSVGNVEAVGARHGRRPAVFGLRVTQ